jgi:hypothetical protein
MKTPKADFPIIFTRLRAILQEHASKFHVSVDKADHYCLEIPYSKMFKKSFPVAWVKLSKSYVSFHYMPVYFAPTLQKSLSPGLKARMQGKSCFNFKTVDDALFEELRQLTRKGFELSKKMNVI